MAVYGSVKQQRNGNLPSGGEQHQGGTANTAVKAWYAAEAAQATSEAGVHRPAPAGGAK